MPYAPAPATYGAAGPVGPPTWYHQAARVSWAAPVVSFALGCLGRAQMEDEALGASVIAATQMVLIAVGLVCGIVALTGVRRVGSRGIVTPAVVGLLLNGLAVAMLLYLLLARPAPPPPLGGGVRTGVTTGPSGNAPATQAAPETDE